MNWVELYFRVALAGSIICLVLRVVTLLLASRWPIRIERTKLDVAADIVRHSLEAACFAFLLWTLKQ